MFTVHASSRHAIDLILNHLASSTCAGWISKMGTRTNLFTIAGSGNITVAYLGQMAV